jgi:hypothetical protein
MGGVNLNTARNNGEKQPYKKDDPYLESNNIGHYGIV